MHDRICPVCCGTEREVTLDCPSDCVYLQQARHNEKPRSIDQVDKELLFLAVDIPERFIYEREPLILGLSFGVAKAARADRSINDRDAIGALTNLAKSYQTLVDSGLVYESATASLPQQAIIAELRSMVEEYRKIEQQNLGYASLRDSEVLRALVFMVRIALGRNNGRPKSRAYLDFLFRQFPEQKSAVVGPDEGSRIIVP
ncbi:MAG TPA: hypothetical protein VKW78_21735 [Terriglobales bacterium]|nr:hypothetical protein [Terriglobales bacterium]